MPKHPGAADAGDGRVEVEGGAMEGSVDAGDESPTAEAAAKSNDVMVATATVGIICVGAALFEAALIPGMIIGVAAMLAPKALPRLGAAVEPVFRGAVRGTYKLGQKARHMVAEAQEQVQDIVAEENAADGAAKPDA
jgi:hypothetical protein